MPAMQRLATVSLAAVRWFPIVTLRQCSIAMLRGLSIAAM